MVEDMPILLEYPKDTIIDGEYLILKHDFTEEDFWRISNEDSAYELIDGVLIIHSPANEEHEDIFSYLNSLLRIYLGKTKKGKVYGSRFVMRLSSSWNPEPDLMIVTPEKYTNITPTRLEGFADVVIEILSKSTRELDLDKKLPKYLENGVKEVWIIDPMTKTISVHSSTGNLTWNDPQSEDVIRSNVFPDLVVKIKWIWNRERYPVHEIITFS